VKISVKNIHFLTFVIVWAAIIVVHTFFIMLTYSFSFEISISDALVFNLLFAILSFGLWHMTTYYEITSHKVTELLINHITAAVVSVAIWISLSVFILKNIYTDNTFYNQFLNQSIPFRAVIGFLFYSASAWSFYMIQMLEQTAWHAEQQEKMSVQLRDSELKALRSQINPHFLFNSLNSIHSLTLSNPDKAGEMILKLSDLMRYSFSKQEQMVAFEEELQQVNRYLDIEKIRFSERLTISINANDETLHVAVPSMILQPIVENAVRYGIYGVEKEVVISLNATIEDNILVVKLSNNYDASVPMKHGTGMGLKNVRERLSTIFHRNDLLFIEKKNDIFEVILKIPYVKS
jgi:two-component system LytT family sensor kinase